MQRFVRRVIDMQHWGSSEPSVSGYIYWDCRCDGCRAAWALYVAKRFVEKQKRGICRTCTRRIWKQSSCYCKAHHLKNNAASLKSYRKRQAEKIN